MEQQTVGLTQTVDQTATALSSAFQDLVERRYLHQNLQDVQGHVVDFVVTGIDLVARIAIVNLMMEMAEGIAFRTPAQQTYF